MPRIVSTGLAVVVLIGLYALVRVDAQPSPFPGTLANCVVVSSTATTLTAVGGDCAAKADGTALYITDIVSSANAGAINADTYNTLKHGTGTACGTGTVTRWQGMMTAATQQTLPVSLRSPIRIPPGFDLCWINSTAGTKAFVISGYRAP